MTQPLPIRAVGVPWYRREDYARVRALMRDGERLPATFAAWLAKARQVIQQVEREGGIAVKAHIDPNTFPQWCAARGLDVDAQGRMQYASWVAFKAHGQTH